MRPKSHFSAAVSFLVIICLVWHSFTSRTPDPKLKAEVSTAEWSTARAMKHVEAIGKQAHYTGSEANNQVREYIINEFKALGLKPQTQKGYSIDPYGNMARPINVMARIAGSNPQNKALLLMTHYDSDPHSAIGASDAGSGVATVLEGVRAFLARGKKPKNDIIILFTDAEELGLVGAQLFVDEHPWAQEVGMVLNFEARGSGGSSYMLVETPGGNRRIIEAFDEADVEYPSANSLAYSIYKMIPNDTDLTVFRRDGDINGLNFAFIGDHFDYHTVLDTPERLDPETLAHQGAYLMPLMEYFVEADLNDGLKTMKGDDHVYFPLPILGLVHFPFSWLGILIIAAGLGLIALIALGLKRRRVMLKDMLLGFIPFLGSLILSYLIITYGWKAISSDFFYINRVRVFPYNGYWWIAAAAMISVAISFFLYHKFYHRNRVASHSVAPLFFLWLILLLIAFPAGDGGLISGVFLPGAGFFVVPLLAGLAMLWLNIRSLRPSFIVLLVLAIPAIYIFAPFIIGFPVALGMKILFVAGILSVLIFGLLLPVIGHYRKKHLLAVFSLFVAVGFFITAFAKAEFSKEQPRASSLVFFQDFDSGNAQWASYDRQLSPWVKEKMGANSDKAGALASNAIDSKYGTRFRFVSKTEAVPMDSIQINVLSDSTAFDVRTVSLKISSKSIVNRYELFADSVYRFNEATINGKKAILNKETGEALTYRRGGRILSLFVSDNEPVELTLTFNAIQKPEILIYAASYDLLENELLKVESRPIGEIPRPFVLNDAIVRKKLIKL